METYTLIEEWVCDNKSISTIVRQNNKIHIGEELPTPIKMDIFKIVKQCCTDFNITIYKHYGDIYIKSQMIRTKYILNEKLNREIVIKLIQHLKDTLNEEFNVKTISYLTSEKDDIIIIWL